MNIAALNAFTEAWNNHDVEGVLSHFDRNGSFHAGMGPEPLGQTFTGHTAIKAALETLFGTYPDGKVVSTKPPILTEQGGLAEWYFEFTMPDGTKARMHGCDIFEFENGKIKSKNVYVKQFVPRV